MLAHRLHNDALISYVPEDMELAVASYLEEVVLQFLLVLHRTREVRTHHFCWNRLPHHLRRAIAPRHCAAFSVRLLGILQYNALRSRNFRTVKNPTLRTTRALRYAPRRMSATTQTTISQIRRRGVVGVIAAAILKSLNSDRSSCMAILATRIRTPAFLEPQGFRQQFRLTCPCTTGSWVIR